MLEQLHDVATGFFTQPQLGRRDSLPQLAEHVIHLQAETRHVQTTGILARILGRGTGMQWSILHQFNDVGWQFQVVIERMDRNQRRPHARPAADQIEVTDIVAVRAGDINQQQRRVGCRAVTRLQVVLQRILDWRVGDLPFLGRLVKAVEFQPDTGRQFTPRPVMFEDHHACVVQATMQDGRHQCRKLCACGRRLLHLRAHRISPRHLPPGGHDLLEAALLVIGERQGPVVVTARHFLLDKAQGYPCLFQQAEQDAGIGRRRQQRIEEGGQLFFSGHRVSEWQCGQIITTGLDVGEYQIGRVDNGVHGLTPFHQPSAHLRWRRPAVHH